MYQKPDFVKVSVKVKDVFAGYNKSGCPMDEGGVNTLVQAGCSDISIPHTTFVAQGWGIGCYHSLNP